MDYHNPEVCVVFKLLKGTVAEAVTTTINVSLNEPIDEETLVNIFQTGILPKKRILHITIFYNEVPHDTQKAFVREYNISKSNYCQIHNKLPDYFQNQYFSELLKGIY